MVINYLKLIFRKIITRPLYPLIAILSLVTGFSAVIIVSVWLADELDYDTFHTKADSLYRITVEINNEETGLQWDFARSSFAWLRNMPEKVPGVEKMVRLARWTHGIVKISEKTWPEEIFIADGSMPEVFTLNFRYGDPATCLSQPKQVILSECYARKYFGDENPLDRTIYIYNSQSTEKKPYRITGVFGDFPPNSHVHPNIITSLDNPNEDLFWAYYYVELERGVRPDDVLSHFQEFALHYISDREFATLTPKLQNIRDIHLKSNKDRELEKNGSMAELRMISLLALFVLCITLFNFFNLRFIYVLKDRKPLGILQFSGARSGSIFGFLLLESFIYACIAAVLSIILVTFAYPYFNMLMNKEVTAGLPGIREISVTVAVLLIFIASVTGILPLFIARTSVFVNSLTGVSSGSALIAKSGIQPGILKTMVGIQYAVTFILLVAVIIVNSQVKLFMDSGLGRNSEKLLCLKSIPVQVVNRYQVFKEELLKNPLILDITSSMEVPGYEIRDMMFFETTGASPEISNKLLYVSPVDDNFFDFYGIPVVAGNNFPKYTGDDSLSESYILNEKALEYLGWKDHEAIGRPFRLRNQHINPRSGRIVGIVKNFQPSSMRGEIKPYVYFQKSFWLYSAQVRYDTALAAESLDFIKTTWSEIYPDYPIEYEFVENLYKEVYKGEFQLKKMSMLLCILAIFLSATGLFAITGIIYEARTKEIGIRKVNGAGITNVIFWLVKDVLIIISLVIIFAMPISYFLIDSWLQNFVHRISPSAWIFILSSILLLIAALITVSWQTWRVAVRNPVEALRYE